MTQRINQFDQPIGDEVADWKPVQLPMQNRMEGIYCRVERLSTDGHLQELYDAYQLDVDGKLWTYMSVGPFTNIDVFRTWMEQAVNDEDSIFYAFIDKNTDRAVGLGSYLRMQPEVGVIEVGNLAYSPLMQKTVVATEAMFLMMQNVFNHYGYRRYEWKCDALNAASRRAAKRLGFRYDGLFEQAIVYKGRNRDTAWFSILDKHWPQIEKGFLQWLDPDNFDDSFIQKQSLTDCLAASISV